MNDNVYGDFKTYREKPALNMLFLVVQSLFVSFNPFAICNDNKVRFW